MPLYFRVGLPGPISYSRRIGGRKRRDPHEAPPAWAVGVALVLMALVVLWILI